MNEQSAQMAGTAMTPFGWLTSALACVLTILMITPFGPAMPFAGIDGSWHYAMNVATAEHFRFGRDLVFTFGPLSSVYTRAYHPATDELMIGGSLVIALALFAGLFTIVAPRRRPLLLLLPVVISLGWSRDAVFMFLPLLLPYVVVRGVERGRPFMTTLCIVAAAVAILPLVKGNFGLMIVVATAVAVILSWGSSRLAALTILGVELVVIVGTWLLVGQRATDLPAYFAAQAPIVSGYTDGMSVVGRSFDLVVFLFAGALLLAISVLSGLRRHWYAPLLVTFYLFVTFKSGFVRHDQHALVAAVALAYIGLLLCLVQGSGGGTVALVVGLVGWALVASAYQSVAPDASAARFAEMVAKPVRGAWLRLSQPGVLPGQFSATTAFIGKQTPFAGYKGTADVYPVDLAPMIAAGSTWTPRPILQSYSAYTPALMLANAAHLATEPPSRAYFKPDPIDRRYPSMEDGASWLSLLGSFTPHEIEGGYAVLDRADPRKPALVPRASVQVDALLGKEVAVTDAGQPVWVTMDVRPSLAGRLFSALYKLPKLSLKVRYEDGSSADYRLIAGMAQAGFLLSPTVSDAKEFVALGSGYRDDFLGKRRVVAFTVVGDSGTRFFWQMAYHVTLAPLDIPSSSAAETALTGVWRDSPGASSYETGGDCNIEDVDGRPVSGAAMDLAPHMVVIKGWAALDAAKGEQNHGIALLVTGHDSVSRQVAAKHVSRPDVSAYFKHSTLEYAGFEAYVDVRQLPTDAQVKVLQSDGARQRLCGPAMLTIHRTD